MISLRLLIPRVRQLAFSKLSGWTSLRRCLGKYRWRILALAALSAGSGVAEAGVLVLIAAVAQAMVLRSHQIGGNAGIPGVNSLDVPAAVVAAVGLALAKLALHATVAWLPARLSADVQSKLRRDIFDAYSSASWERQSKDGEGYLQELMTDQVVQATYAIEYVSNVLTALAMFVTLVISAFVVNAIVAAIVLVSAIALFEAIRPVDRLGRRAAAGLSATSMDFASSVSESVRLAEEAQVFGVTNGVRTRVEDLITAVSERYFRTDLTSRMVQNVYQGLVILLIVLGLGGLYLAGSTHLVSLGAVVLMLVRASAYSQQFQAAKHRLDQKLPYLERLTEAIDAYRKDEIPSGTVPLTSIGRLVFDQVSFEYRSGSPVLQGVSFAIEPGEAIGIIGPTGAGKSTVIQLLLRLRTPGGGRLLLNGEDLASFARADWQRMVAYVPQEPKLLQATVAENIRFFRDIDDADVERAARLAHLHEEVMAMPAGYDTVIGQRSEALSGGQRQRLCLARALAGDPKLIILDEPTSALDVASEVAIRQSLAGLRTDLTIVIAAHRLAILELCDRILVLQSGRVEAFATPDQLPSLSHFYRRITGLSAAVL